MTKKYVALDDLSILANTYVAMARVMIEDHHYDKAHQNLVTAAGIQQVLADLDKFEVSIVEM